MTLRLVLYASLALLCFGLSGAPTLAAKGGCIDPNGGQCHAGGNGGSADGGSHIDPNGN